MEKSCPIIRAVSGRSERIDAQESSEPTGLNPISGLSSNVGYRCRDSPSFKRIVIQPDLDVDHRHVQRVVLQGEILVASGSVRAVLDRLARHACKIAQEVATRSPRCASFLSTRDTRSNSDSTFGGRRCSQAQQSGFATFVSQMSNRPEQNRESRSRPLRILTRRNRETLARSL